MVLQSLQGLPAFIAYFCLATVKTGQPSVGRWLDGSMKSITYRGIKST
jgi:hypothetical protein